jgi:hypothetical protein
MIAFAKWIGHRSILGSAFSARSEVPVPLAQGSLLPVARSVALNDQRQSGSLTDGDRRGERLQGEVVSAGHSLRRQNYSFVTITPAVVPDTAMHAKRVIIAIMTAVALDLATFATIATLIH